MRESERGGTLLWLGTEGCLNLVVPSLVSDLLGETDIRNGISRVGGEGNVYEHMNTRVIHLRCMHA